MTIDASKSSGMSLECYRANEESDRSTISTNATESDRPGPGRLIDNLYSRAGRLLEDFVGRIAHQCGYGPHAVFLRLTVPLEQSRVDCAYWLEKNNTIRAVNDWELFLKYLE